MRTVVLDDDPTGTQAATGVTVLFDLGLLETDPAALVDALRADGAVYVQTNSRAIDGAAAVRLAERLRTGIAAAEAALGESVLVVLRGDSTLRGHVFAESDAFAGEDGRILLVPAFPGGGRTTVGGVHRVRIEGVDVPVGETEFARDPVFGFRSSHLVDWVAEVGGRRAVSVPLERLRATGGLAVADALAGAGPREVVAPDVETDEDIRLVHAGLTAALHRGIRVVVRSAATLAAVCAGRLSPGLLPRPLAVPAPGVLVVCGSHTGAAGAQLARLRESLGEPAIVVPTDAAYADAEAAGAEAAALAAERLAAGGVAILASERERRAEDGTLAHGEAVMRALTAATRALVPGVGTVVSKGGITSAEVARAAIGATSARVRGQVAPGVSVFDLAGRDGVPRVQVVVPGNVGGPDTLVDILSALP